MNFQFNEGLSKKKKEKLLSWTQLNMSFTFFKMIQIYSVFEIHIWSCARSVKTDADF